MCLYISYFSDGERPLVPASHHPMEHLFMCMHVSMITFEIWFFAVSIGVTDTDGPQSYCSSVIKDVIFTSFILNFMVRWSQVKL